eukprot:9315670-Prorocentrum_lima.AAC.1
MTLQSWLRRVHAQGEIAVHLKRLHRRQAGAGTLEDFANADVRQGEILIAAMTRSRLTDAFFAQWLLLH